ncbi:MAG: nodulation efficiency protein D (NfeD) [Paludibacter sp.]|nr:nodulation efficiency protein D (NfeD) [Paludibacter sp.]
MEISVALIVILLVVGIVFLIIELFLIPGTSIAGIASAILLICAVYFAYKGLGATAGNITLISSVVLAGIAIWLFVHMRTFDKIELKTEIKSKVDPLKGLNIKVGDKGRTQSRLAPMGKVMIDGNIIEAKTRGEFLDHNTEIVVVEVLSTNVLVEKSS